MGAVTLPALGESAAPTSSPQPASALSDAGQPEEGDRNVAERAVDSIDSFFASELHTTFAEQGNRLRLRLNVDQIEHHGWDISEEVKVNLALTELGKRLRFVANDDDETEDPATEFSDEGNDVALRWIGSQSEKRSLSLDAGLRIKSGSVDPFIRLNTSIRYPITERWLGQSTNRIYHYSKTGWRDDFRQYFNRPLSDDLLFRSRTRIQYFEEKRSNPYLEQKFSLFQSLKDRAAVAYEVLWRRESREDSVFNRDEITVAPQTNYQKVVVRLRYRQNFWRPWMFVEFWPSIGWAEERDWDRVLGARVRFEINFGRHKGLKLGE
jgi:hypothetical protein